jgi:hypothetical protein
MKRRIAAVGRFFGNVLDAEDRAILAQAFVIVTSAALLVITAAGSLGLAFRVFEIARG